MKKILFILPLIICCLLNCKPKPTGAALQAGVPWQTLTIIDEKTNEFSSQHLMDPGHVIIHHRGSFFAPLKKEIKSDTLRVSFTEAENDSLVNLMKDLIIHPIKTNKFCTEYVGSLYLKIDYGQFELSGRYSSVCDWSMLSEKTKQLKKILNRKFAEAKKYQNRE